MKKYIGFLYNSSACRIEPCKKTRCPRCKGHGGTVQDRGENCSMCGGHGYIMLSTKNTSCYRKMYERVEVGRFY